MFRAVEPWNLWVWVQLSSSLGEEERLDVEEIFKAWFILGKLGGFNSANLQVQQHVDAAGDSVSNLRYVVDEQGGPLSVFHAMGDVEFRDNWARCWFDLGTSDELALDVLINSLTTFSKEHVPITQLVIGGINADWAEGVDEPAKLVWEERGPA